MNITSHLPNHPFILIDCDFILQQIGLKASKFADCPEYLEVGQDARLAFPELIGLEEVLLASSPEFEAKLLLEGLSRFQDGETPFYFDLWIVRQEENPELYWIGFEDSTQRTLNKQAILHHANAAEILIAQLSASQQYIDAIIHSMAEALIVTDNRGKIKSLNPAALQLFKHSIEALVSQPITTLLPLPHPGLGLESDRPTEIMYQTETGENQYLSFTCTQIKSGFEQWQGFIYLGRDITERKETEMALLQANAELQYRNQNLSRLIEFSQILNRCTNREELNQEIASFLPNFFQNWTGYLELNNPHWQTLVAWGDSEKLNFPPKTFKPCQQQPAIAQGELCDRCLAHTDDKIHCIPLMNQDQILGILHLRVNSTVPGFEAQTQLAIALGEQITLALVNVTLRETLEAESIRDALTHLYNRRYLTKTLPEALKQAQSRNQSLCIVMVDVDRFKHLNDTWGHQTGDRVLEVVGSYLAQKIRHNDIAYRYGGEEFLIILKNIEAAIAYNRIEQLREGLRDLAITDGDRTLTITVSCGIASFPQCGQTETQLLQGADRALYQAKAQGRDRTILANCCQDDSIGNFP